MFGHRDGWQPSLPRFVWTKALRKRTSVVGDVNFWRSLQPDMRQFDIFGGRRIRDVDEETLSRTLRQRSLVNPNGSTLRASSRH